VNPLTRRAARRLGAPGRVPVLTDGDRVVDGSDAIAAYLDEAYPDPPLLPAEPQQRAEALALVQRCDLELGPDARRVAYDLAFAHPALFEGTLTFRRAPWRWLNPLLVRILEPRLRRLFKIYPDELQASRRRLRSLLADLQELLDGRSFLVGDRLTLADITAASLLDPLELVPEFVRDCRYAPVFDWKRRLARAHDRRQRSPWIEGPPPLGYPLGQESAQLPHEASGKSHVR
jgi:glutathione S-transferase